MDTKAVKDRERKFREKEIPFGAHTVSTKTQWFSEIELRNVAGRLGVRERGIRSWMPGAATGVSLNIFTGRRLLQRFTEWISR